MTIRVACAIVIYESKILVTQRSGFMNQAFKWEFPGGKIESHESDEVCIKREILEELNIEIKVIRCLPEHEYTEGNSRIVLVPFIAEYLRGNITLLEHMNYEWLSFNQLHGPDWAPADVGLVQNLSLELKSIFVIL